MHDEIQQLELFEKYLSGDLSGEDKFSFEQRLNSEDDFAKEFELYQNMLKGIRSYDTHQLKNDIQSLEGKLESSGFFIDDEAIANYISGSSDEHQKHIIEKRIARDAEFGKKVDFEKSLLKGIKESEQSDLKAVIAATHKKLESKGFFEEVGEEKKSTKKDEGRIIPLWKNIGAIVTERRFGAIAAAMTLIAIISTVVLLNISTSIIEGANQLALNDLKNVEGNKGNADPSKDQIYKEWENAIAQYNKGDTKTPLSFFQSAEYTKLEPKDTSDFLYNLALLEMVNGNYEKANDIFERIESTNPSDITWQKAVLMMYQEKPKADIIQAFTKIKDNPGFSSERRKAAEKALKTIKKIKE